MALPGLELTSSNDNKTARETRQTRWSLFTLTAAWATSTDQRREARVPKNIRSEASDQFTQAGLTESRKAEWAKWKQFNAVFPVSGPELEQLSAQGHKPIPLQWIEIDKNEHKRREGGPPVAPLFKSRLVSRGDLEEDHWCKNGLSNLRHRRVEPSPVVGFVRAPHGQVGRHHERLLSWASVGNV